MVDPRPRSVRLAEREDATEIARLLSLLDHPTDAARVERLWDAWTGAGDLALVAPRDDGSLRGVVTLHRMTVLHRPRPVGRITSLVVDPADRGAGIGRALVDAALRQLADHGCGLVEVTSHVRRTDAHAFYEHLGFARTSHRFGRDVTEASER